MNTNFKVIGLTRLGIKPESTAQETDAQSNQDYFATFMTAIAHVIVKFWRNRCDLQIAAIFGL